MKTHNMQPEWLTDDLRSQFSSVLVTMPNADPAAKPPSFNGDFAGMPGSHGHFPAVQRYGPEPRAHFQCTHCEAELSVASLPARGTCPSCGGQLEVSVRNYGFWPRAAVWVPWLLSLFLLLVIVWGLVIIGNRLGFGSLDVEAYDPVRDNRFSSWPWSLRSNQHCRIPPGSITGIGWDSRGGSHALVDPSYVAITHNTPPGKLYFADEAGRIHSRSVDSHHTLSTDAASLPWIRLCRLDSPLPPSVRPLPILELSGEKSLELPLFMVGRHGRIGSEFPGSLDILYRASLASESLTSIGAFVAPRKQVSEGYGKLRTGDSGSPLIARIGDDYCLVGLACAVMGDRGAAKIHIHALLSPQLREMKLAGAKPCAVRFDRPDPKLLVAHW